MNYTLHYGDCLDILRTLPDNSVDAIVTDPPYGLSFMGKRWDYDVPSEDVWRECLRVLKPGGHLLAFAGTRTQHRMAVRIEDAGFEIRDMIAWVYGSGFPKSLDVSKAIDKAAGVEGGKGAVTGKSGSKRNSMAGGDFAGGEYHEYLPATPAARQWHGWGTALKPALEPITVARKPLIGTVAENVLTWGTGGVNVDGCRVEVHDKDVNMRKNGAVCNPDSLVYDGGWDLTKRGPTLQQGRWPANLIHDGSEEVVELFPTTSTWAARNPKTYTPDSIFGVGGINFREADSGSAARFFYCAKASKRDRDDGCEGMEERRRNSYGGEESRVGKIRSDGAIQNAAASVSRNHHPTVKPTDLMRYLCRLVTPPEGTVLDPFMGSGSTGKAAMLEDFNFVGIEREAEYLDIARARIEHAINNKPNKLL